MLHITQSLIQRQYYILSSFSWLYCPYKRIIFNFLRINGVDHSYMSGKAKRLHEYQTIQVSHCHTFLTSYLRERWNWSILHITQSLKETGVKLNQVTFNIDFLEQEKYEEHRSLFSRYFVATGYFIDNNKKRMN